MVACADLLGVVLSRMDTPSVRWFDSLASIDLVKVDSWIDGINIFDNLDRVDIQYCSDSVSCFGSLDFPKSCEIFDGVRGYLR